MHAIVRRFQKNEYQLDLQRPRQPRPNARKLTTAQMEALTTPELLREQAHLNLLQRCVLIERQLQVVISTSTLRNAYKKMGVGFLKVHRGWYAAHSEMELRRQRVLFCRKMEAHLAESREIIYIDETSTNCWMARGKIWQPRNSVLPLVFLELPKAKEENCTIIGAISNKRDYLVANITYSTNKETVEHFFRHFHGRVGLEDKVIVMDNHRAHWANDVREFIEDRGGTLEFMPPSSSYFNPIETAWAWVKARWSNELIALNGRQPNTEWMYETLLQICNSMPGPVVDKIAHCCEKLLRSYLLENDPPLPGEDLADGEWHQIARRAEILSRSNILSQGNNYAGRNNANRDGAAAGAVGPFPEQAHAQAPGSARASRKREGAANQSKNTASKALAFFNRQDSEMNDD